MLATESPCRLDTPALPAGEDVHIWVFSLLPADGCSPLVAADQERAARMAPRHRARFLATRAAVRAVLARALGADPSDVVMADDVMGKPRLLADVDLRFSLAHSGNLGVVALTMTRDIGVDIEDMRRSIEVDRIIRACFSRREIESLASAPQPERHAAVLTGWTRKEAYLKATGRGLSYPMRQVEVTLAPGDQPRIVAIDGSAEAAAGWSLRALDGLPPPYIGAVVVAGGIDRVCYGAWPQGQR